MEDIYRQVEASAQPEPVEPELGAQQPEPELRSDEEKLQALLEGQAQAQAHLLHLLRMQEMEDLRMQARMEETRAQEPEPVLSTRPIIPTTCLAPFREVYHNNRVLLPIATLRLEHYNGIATTKDSRRMRFFFLSWLAHAQLRGLKMSPSRSNFSFWYCARRDAFLHWADASYQELLDEYAAHRSQPEMPGCWGTEDEGEGEGGEWSDDYDYEPVRAWPGL